MGNISPLDIRKQTFRTTFRGLDREEVRVFLDLLATEQDRLIELNENLMDRVRHCEDRLAEYKELDQTLRNTVLNAEKQASSAREASQREASLVIQETEWRAKQMLEDARERLNRLSQEIRDLHAKKDAYTQHLRSFLKAHGDLLDRNESYLEGIDQLMDETSSLMARIRRPEAQPAPPHSPQPMAIPAPSMGAPLVGQPPAAGARPPMTSRPSQTGPGSPEVSPAPMHPGQDRNAERHEGLFEISADEEDSTRQ